MHPDGEGHQETLGPAPLSGEGHPDPSPLPERVRRHDTDLHEQSSREIIDLPARRITVREESKCTAHTMRSIFLASAPFMSANSISPAPFSHF